MHHIKRSVKYRISGLCFDALSSTAYATQELLVILILAGAGALQFAFRISLAIVVLLVILTISYEQTIHAYPGGGERILLLAITSENSLL